MHRTCYGRYLALWSFALLALLLASCGDEASTNPPGNNNNGNTQDTVPVVVSLKLNTMMGSAPFSFDSVATSESGAQYKVSLFRYYITQVMLLDSSGIPLPVTLVNTAGTPLKYNIALVDYEKPESLTLRVIARKGNYKGIRFMIGIPATDDKGEQLNHADASAMEYPLDVDADMYWGWNPGYIFLKVEGKSYKDGEWLPFFYHIGEDKRVMRLTADGPVAIAGTNPEVKLKVDLNRLFVTPAGAHSPNIIGGIEDRIANNGPQTDIMSRNCIGSNFITLMP